MLFPLRHVTFHTSQAMAAPPILGYNGHRDFVDIPWPDYNFWGHEVARLVDEQASGAGWRWDDARPAVPLPMHL